MRHDVVVGVPRIDRGLEDLDALALDPGDISDLARCRPGNCGVKLSDVEIARQAPRFFFWFELVSVAIFTIEYTGSVSVVTLVAPLPMPCSVVSKNSSTVSFSVWPRTNCSTGESMPGIATSAIWAPFSRLNSPGLYCTSMKSSPASYSATSMAFCSCCMVRSFLNFSDCWCLETGVSPLGLATTGGCQQPGQPLSLTGDRPLLICWYTRPLTEC